MLKNFKTRGISLFIAVASVTTVGVSTLVAQTTTSTGTSSTGGGGGGAEAYLYQIMQNTAGILTQVNNLPTYLETITLMALSWMAPDDSQATADVQGTFSTYANTLTQNLTLQNGLQASLMTGLPTQQLTAANANDLSYFTLLGMPPIAKDTRKNTDGTPVDAAMNYIKNASGLNVYHTVPSPAWTGGIGRFNYTNYFNTTLSVESFNAYVLGDVYADYKNGGLLSTTQQKLITQASGSNWFSQIASANLGVVLRQLLMYQSQSYILMTESLKTQKQLLIAQVLNSTLLVLLNQNNEQTMIQKASGLPNK